MKEIEARHLQLGRYGLTVGRILFRHFQGSFQDTRGTISVALALVLQSLFVMDRWRCHQQHTGIGMMRAEFRDNRFQIRSIFIQWNMMMRIYAVSYPHLM